MGEIPAERIELPKDLRAFEKAFYTREDDLIYSMLQELLELRQQLKEKINNNIKQNSNHAGIICG